MEFFIDTANIPELRKAHELGIVDGVTTNPSLIKKSGQNHEETIREIASFITGPISVETLSSSTEGIIKEAKEYLTWGNNIVIKVVMSPEGIKAVKALSQLNIKTNVTVVFSPLQALIAAKAGATYVSPFIGRLDDIGHHGLKIIKQIKRIYNNYPFTTKILVASIRHPLHILEAAQIGADVATIPPEIIHKIMKHPLTDIGITQFLNDAKEWKKNS